MTLKNEEATETAYDETVVQIQKVKEALKIAKEQAVLRKQKEAAALKVAKASAAAHLEKIKATQPGQRHFILSSEKEKFQKRIEEQKQQKGQRRKARRNRVVKSKLAQAYLLLGVEDTASPQALKKAYREKMKQSHPDKVGEIPQKIEQATAKTIELKEAYETILACLQGEKHDRKSAD